jgi:hypothetical protein
VSENRLHVVGKRKECRYQERKVTMDYYPRCNEKVSEEEICCSESVGSRGRHREVCRLEMFEFYQKREVVVNCARCHGTGWVWVDDKAAGFLDRLTGASVKQVTCSVCGGRGKVRV